MASETAVGDAHAPPRPGSEPAPAPPRPHAVPTAELSSCQSSMTCSQFLVQQCSPANVAGGFSFQAEPRETMEECLANNEAVEVAFQACVDEGLLPLAGFIIPESNYTRMKTGGKSSTLPFISSMKPIQMPGALVSAGLSSPILHGVGWVAAHRPSAPGYAILASGTIMTVLMVAYIAFMTGFCMLYAFHQKTKSHSDDH